MKELFKHRLYSFDLDDNKGILKLAWTEETSNMEDQNFKDCLLEFARLAGEYKPSKLWVDSEKFKHSVTEELLNWRKETIIPSFQEAGVSKLAFQVGVGGEIMPPGATDTGLHTECFETEEKVLEWFEEE